MGFLDRLRGIERRHWHVCYTCMMESGHDAVLNLKDFGDRLAGGAEYYEARGREFESLRAYHLPCHAPLTLRISESQSR